MLTTLECIDRLEKACVRKDVCAAGFKEIEASATPRRLIHIFLLSFSGSLSSCDDMGVEVVKLNLRLNEPAEDRLILLRFLDDLLERDGEGDMRV